MTHEETILKLYDIFGVGSISTPKWPDKPCYSNRKKIWRWATANRMSLKVAQMIEPYVVTKRDAVALILANYDITQMLRYSTVSNIGVS